MNNPQLAEYIVRLKDRDADVRASAAEALGEMGDSAAVPALIETCCL